MLIGVTTRLPHFYFRTVVFIAETEGASDYWK